MNTSDQSRFRIHAELIGLKVATSCTYGEISQAYLMADDNKKFIMGFACSHSGSDSINVSWFVGNKQYNATLTLDQFQQLTLETLSTFRRGSSRANQEADAIAKRLKEIPITFKTDTLVLLGIK